MPTRPKFHQPPFKLPPAEQRPTSHARGYDRSWERLRKAFLWSNPFCFNCNGFASVVDHRVPIAVDPSRRLDATNLRSCCPTCHNALTNAFKATGVNELPTVRPTHIRSTQCAANGQTQLLAGA